MKALFIIGILTVLIYYAKGANILGLFAMPSQSHFNAIQPLLVGLSKKQHNVTSVSSFRLGDKLDNYEEIFVPPFDFWLEVQKGLGIQSMFQATEVPSSRLHKALRNAGAALINNFLSNPKVKELLNPIKTFPYDVIIIDLFYTEALLMIGKVYDKPIVAISSSNFGHYITNFIDHYVPSACLPIHFQNNMEYESFLGRALNIFECIQRMSWREDDLFAQESVAKSHFEKFNVGHQTDIILQEQISILLVNNYAPLLAPRPILSNIIPVGGLHIKPTQDIQWNIKRFLDDARDGAIYLSFGTTLQCSDLPKEKLNILITTLAKQKQRILWHCNLKKIENPQKNILLQNIISSSDVLAHPHVKLFITSGGLLGLQEAIYRNVPILGIPVFHDQQQNMKNIEDLKIGIKLDYTNITQSSLSWALDALTTDRSFLSNIRDVSSKYRDRPLGAIQMAMYWVEHVLRQTNVSHLKTGEAHRQWHRQYLIDVLALLVISAMVLVFLSLALYKIIKLLSKKREQNKLYTKLQ